MSHAFRWLSVDWVSDVICTYTYVLRKRHRMDLMFNRQKASDNYPMPKRYRPLISHFGCIAEQIWKNPPELRNNAGKRSPVLLPSPPAVKWKMLVQPEPEFVTIISNSTVYNLPQFWNSWNNLSWAISQQTVRRRGNELNNL